MIDINRKTESIIDVLSASGGLLRALMVITNIFVGPYNRFVLHSLLTVSLVRFVPSQHSGVQQGRYQREFEFKQKYIAEGKDSKRKNLLRSLIENFSLD